MVHFERLASQPRLSNPAQMNRAGGGGVIRLWVDRETDERDRRTVNDDCKTGLLPLFSHANLQGVHYLLILRVI